MSSAIPTILSVTCFLRNGDDVLLMKRGAHKRHEPNKYSGVGGKIDPGETTLGAAVRETAEETGLQLRLDQFVFKGKLILDGYAEGRWVVSLFEAWTDTREVAQTDEGELMWVPIGEIKSKELMDDIRLYIDTLLESNSPIYGYFMFDKDAKVVKHTIDSHALAKTA